MAPNRSSPPRPLRLVVVQAEASVLMSLAIGQAGLAAAFLTGHKQLKEVHAVNGLLLVVVTLLTLVGAVLYQRQGGPRWPVAAAVLLIVLEAVQLALAAADVAGLHIFLGVLFVVAATLFTSYLFRPGFSTSRRRS